MRASKFIVCAALTALLASCAPLGNVYTDLAEPGAYTASQSVGEALQMPDYPAGCEPISLTIMLHAYSYDIGMPEIMRYFDRSDTDFVHAFWGSEYSEGAAYPPAVVEAANRYLLMQGSSLEARDITGAYWGTIEAMIGDGVPVMVWTTTDFKSPVWSGWDVDGWPMYANEHCVVVYGQDGSTLYVSDPLEGLITRPMGEFARIWEQCGSMAVALGVD